MTDSIAFGGLTFKRRRGYVFDHSSTLVPTPPVAPTLSSLNYDQGDTAGGGDSIVITGENFDAVTSVKFGSTNAVFTIDSSTQITAILPASAAGVTTVTAVSSGGTSNGISFEYWSPLEIGSSLTGLWRANGSTGYTFNVSGPSGTFEDATSNNRDLTSATAAPPSGTALEGHTPPETTSATSGIRKLVSAGALSNFIASNAYTMWSLTKTRNDGTNAFPDAGGTWAGCYLMNGGTALSCGIGLTGTGSNPSSVGRARTWLYDGGIRLAEGPTTLSLDTWYLIVGTFSGGALTSYANGTAGTPVTGIGTISDLTQPLRIYANANDSVAQRGPIAETGVMNAAIDSTAHAKLLKYCRQRYGVTLA